LPSTGKGEYYRPIPIDFLLLEVIPERGLIGGVHWRGRLVSDIIDELAVREDIDGSSITSSMVQSRMRSMRLAGYVEPFEATGAAGRSIWARTKAGSEYLARRDEVLGL